MSPLQHIFLTCLLGPEDPTAFRRAQDAAKSRERWAKNPERQKEHSRAWRVKNPGKVRAWLEKHRSRNRNFRLQRDYGVSAGGVEKLREVQGNSCAICYEPFLKTPHVDHNHKTGEVRGLLCRGCNLALGYLKDSSDRCKSAERYLREGGNFVSR
jgi:hypothetical protein